MKKTLAGRLKFLIISAIILSVLIPVVSTTAYLIYNIKRDVGDKNRLLTAGLSYYISGFLNNAFDINHHIAANGEIVRLATSFEPDFEIRKKEYDRRFKTSLTIPEEGAGEPILNSAQLRHAFIELLYLQDAQGNQAARSFGPIGRRADRWWFKPFSEGKYSPFISNSYFSLTGQVPVISIWHPVMDEGQFAGILGMDINFGYIQDIMQDFIEDENIIAIVIDSDGAVISHPDPTVISGKYNLAKAHMELLTGEEEKDTFFLLPGSMDEEGLLPSEVKPLEIDDSIILAAQEALKGGTGFIPDVIYEGRPAELHYRPVELPAKNMDGEDISYGLLLLHYTDQVQSYVATVVKMVGGLTLLMIACFIFYINFRISLLLKDIMNLEKKKEELLEFAYRDPLTGLYNRRHFVEEGALYYARAERTGGGLAVMMLDLDHFKRVNDTYGHDCGDYVLQTVSQILLENIRENDFAARMGGEEFCILLDKIDPEEPKILAERIRKIIENFNFSYEGKSFNVTTSIGVCLKFKSSLDKMVRKADFLLYHSKMGGRNRVTLEGEETS